VPAPHGRVGRRTDATDADASGANFGRIKGWEKKFG
jgi:hypothetical protein